ncbi:DNA pilot protein [Sigmofec virus UA08Rod_7382]|uniref:DNA pilot protein n=1 Tax=Sigmofec virus UA08Rod_7382 TaxID=2929246 RepID=A0A976R7S5_9VIRU|nr:DNA pilot protein [Sigmofec virus UA08Rod_7382]
MGLFDGIFKAISSPFDALTGGAISDYFNRKQESRQYHRQTEFWRTQAEYDSPANQMARFKEAGLNPNLIYGQSNTSGSLPAVTTGRHNISAEGPLSSYLNKTQQEANISAIRETARTQQANRINGTNVSNAEVDLKKAQVRELNARTAQIRQSTGIDRSNSSVDGDLISYKQTDPFFYRLGSGVINKLGRFFGGFRDNLNSSMFYTKKHKGTGYRYYDVHSDYENYLRSFRRY